MPIEVEDGHSSPGWATPTPTAVSGSAVPSLSLAVNATEYAPSVAPAVTVTWAVADEAAGTVRVPLVGVTVRLLLGGVAVQLAVIALLVRLSTVSVAVPVDPGATTRPLAGPAESSAVCSPVESEGGAALALLAQDLFGVLDRV